MRLRFMQTTHKGEAMNATIRLLVQIAIVTSVISLSGCTKDVPPIGCDDPDFNCYSQQAVRGIAILRRNISTWANWNRALQISSVICSIIATIMIALQGEQNKAWTRPIGLVASALVTGLASAAMTLHMDENVDRHVDILERMANITNEFGYKSDELAAGRTLDELKQLYKKDADFRDKTNKLTKRFVDDYNKAKIDLLRLSGATARLGAVAAPPKDQTPAASAKDDSAPKKKTP